MSNSRRPRVNTTSRVTMRLRDLALDEREHAYYGPRMGDWLLLGFVVVALLANGLYVWRQLGPAHEHTGRAIFFGLALLAAFWATLVFTFKLSVCVRVGAHGITIVRGPWHTELAWGQVSRLVERVQVVNQRRLRWVVAVARDGRSLQVREDMVTDYGAFRVEVWERFRLWRDHGGTWGTTGAGPFTARESASAQSTWWIIVGLAALLPGLYFSLVLTEIGIVGPILVLGAVVCGLFSVRAMLRRRTYTVDAKGIQCRQVLGTTRLGWRDVKKIERTRRSFGGITELSIRLGRAALSLAARGDSRVESFDWSPRVPEYLALRGAGRQVRIRLHRLARPDEMLAWVEFYERAARHLAEVRESRRTVPPAAAMPTGAPAARSAPDLTRTATMSRPVPEALSSAAPADPWAPGREGAPGPDTSSSRPEQATSLEPTEEPTEPLAAMPSGESSEAWLRAETSGAWHPGMGQTTTAHPSSEMRREEAATNRPEGPALAASAQAGTGPTRWESSDRFVRAEPEATKETDKAPAPPPDRWNPAEWHSQPAQSMDYGRVAQFSQPPWPEPAVPDVPNTTSANWQQQGGQMNATELAGGVIGAVTPQATDGTPTDSVEPLADAFKLWGPQASNERPKFPRFGPPLEAKPNDEADAQQFERDDFLR